MKIAIASANQGKIKEFKAILEPLGYELISAKELGIDMDLVEETGETFEANAKLKSQYLYEQTKMLSIADDSGIVITALPDILGVKSARFMGHDTSYEEKNNQVISLLNEKEDRSAYFISAISLTGEDTQETFEGIIHGHISNAILGANGFGYDPIFIPEGFDTSFGLIDKDVKNEISHRARSLRKLTEYFNEL